MVFVYCDCHYLSMHSPNWALLSQIMWSLILFAVGSCLTLQPSPFNHHSTERVAGQCNVWFCSVWLPMGVEGRSLCQPFHSSSSSALCVPRQGWCPELHCSGQCHRSSVQAEVRPQADSWRSLPWVFSEVR